MKTIHPKRLGAIAELVFALHCLACGLKVTTPFGECDPFDFIVYSPRTQRMLRVQVRCGTFMQHGSYTIPLGRRHPARRYTRRHVDLVAAYVLPHNAWYLIPVDVIKSPMARFAPHRPTRAWTEKYREAWDLLM